MNVMTKLLVLVNGYAKKKERKYIVVELTYLLTYLLMGPNHVKLNKDEWR